MTTGSRAVEVYAEAESHELAAKAINEFIERGIHFKDWRKVWRKDIGTHSYLAKRMEKSTFVRTVYAG